MTPEQTPDPQSKHQCGNVYWCCAALRCLTGKQSEHAAHFICPKDHGSDNTRAAAWKIWDHDYITPQLKEMQAEHGVCWIQASSCYETARTAGTCGNYPN
jgi:hypothetical protein